MGLPALPTIEVAVARTLAEAADTEETYNRVLAEIGHAVGWELGAVWEVSSDDELRCVALWQAAEAADTREFRSLTERITMSRGKGLPGRVWASGAPAWVVGVVADANFPRAHAAARADLHAAFCFPLRDPGAGA